MSLIYPAFPQKGLHLHYSCIRTSDSGTMSSRTGPSTANSRTYARKKVMSVARTPDLSKETIDPQPSEDEEETQTDIQDDQDDAGSSDDQSPDSEGDIEAVKPRRRAGDEQIANGESPTTSRRLQ